MRVRATISAEVTDLQRTAIAAHYDGDDMSRYDNDGHLERRTGMRKATHAEVQEYVQTYGWSGLDGNLNDILAALGLEPTHQGAQA
jgi:hypothetical protein